MTQTRKEIHSWIFLFGLALALTGLPLSRFLLSVSAFVLAGNWILEGGFREKLQRLRTSPVLFAVLGFFLLYPVSFLWSENLEGWWHHVRVALPLFVFPLIIGTSDPLPVKRWTALVVLFTVAILVKSFIGLGIYLQLWGKPITDIREITGSLSNIRFSLMICVDLVLLYFLVFQRAGIRIKLIVAATGIFLLFMLLLLKSLTGLAILGTAGIFLLFIYLLRAGRNKVTLGIGAVLLLGIFYGGYRVWEVYTRYFIPIEVQADPLTKTALGNSYTFDTSITMIENGHRVGDFLAWGEMTDAWNKRSDLKIPGRDRRGNELNFTLIRFLTSKGWRKDADAVERLTQSEVTAIENSCANVVYLEKGPLTARIHQVLWELNEYFNRGADPSGHSVTQRLEFWKATWHCWKKNIAFGVGTGDLDDCLKSSYEEVGTRLKPENRLRPHNQFLSIAAGTGILGLILFLLSMVWPFRYKKHRRILYGVFILIMTLSMLTEDTLETQTGITLFSVFNGLLLFHFPEEKRV